MLFGWRTNGAKRPWRISAKLLIVSSVATVIGFSAICASVMIDMRHGEEELARQTLENLASSIDAEISRNVDLYDLSLRAVASNMLMPELKQVSTAIRHLILFDHAATAKHFGSIQIFDAEGRLAIDASTFDPPPEDRSDEEFFQVHRDRPDAGLFISRPMLHRGAYAIVLSRRVTGADGGFLGVVAGSIRFSYFHDLFGRLRLGPEDRITVLRRDATRPLVVLVGKPWSSILSLWHKEATRIGAIMLALIAFVLAATLFLAREIGRRARAEDKLEELATTDALTGLKNLRKFDAEIDAEWRRAVRQKMPLALLMIDADHFKSYNDTFGHQAGDEVLVGIAICISDSVRRAGDCAARYGGEEFAVLLPGFSEAAAVALAETIRLRVLQWSDGPRVTTVSIGIASLTPSAAIDSSILVKAADRALYAAKANGRNQYVLASLPRLSRAA